MKGSDNMNKKLVILGILLLVGVMLSSCVWYGGGYGYGYAPDYSFSYNYGYPYSHGYSYGYPNRYPHRYPTYPHGGDHHHEPGNRPRY